MSKKVSVILLEDVAGVGKTGEVVIVAEGYARNALFPHGKAALAGSAKASKAQAKQESKRAKDKANLKDFQSIAERLDATELEIKAKVQEGEGGTLFGSVKARDIVQQLENQANVSVTAKQVSLEAPIKQLGTHPVTVELSSDVEFTIHVVVTADDEED